MTHILTHTILVLIGVMFTSATVFAVGLFVLMFVLEDGSPEESTIMLLRGSGALAGLAAILMLFAMAVLFLIK